MMLAFTVAAAGTACAGDDDPDRPVDTAKFAADPSVYQDFDVPSESPRAPAPQTPKAQAVARPAAAKPRQTTSSRPKERKGAAKAPSRPEPVDIPAGCFQMGSPDGIGARNERPRHEVCLHSFRMDRLPVLQRQYEEATGTRPWTLCEGSTCAPPDPRAPAWFVTWGEANDFCHQRGGRLPTEAEYEYAERAGDSGSFAWGDTASQACQYANLADLSLKRALASWKVFPCDDGQALVSVAGTRSPNRWGLSDMVGNVWEWTADWYASDWYSRSPRDNPRGPDSGTGRVMRGGSWLTGPDGARAAYRDGFQPEGRYAGSIGFRCVYPSKGSSSP
jgi:formylglycine-generating enzyme required for sulfatase activity